MRLESTVASVLLAFALESSARAEDFTIVIFGDTQDYTDSSVLEPVFENMIDYVIARAQSDNIKLVLHVGDAIQQGFLDTVSADTSEEWARFNAQWKRLDSVVPYAVVRGNHDNTEEFSLHYGSTPSSAFPHYRSTHPPGDDDAHAWTVDLAGQDAIVLGISCNPSSNELAWAQRVLDRSPDLPAIVVSHILTTPFGFHTASSSGSGQPTCNGNPPLSIWRELVLPNNEQIFMIASGHVIHPAHGFKAMSESSGASVLDTFQNWQGGAAANGCMTLVRFRPGVLEVEVEAFCTELGGGAGAFLNAPGETTLAAVTLDDPCLNFSLFDGVGPPPPCAPPPDPTPGLVVFQEGVTPSGGYVSGAVTVRSDSAGTNQKSSDQIIVGRSMGGAGGPLHGLLEFDLSQIEIEAGGEEVTIDDVSLVMVTCSPATCSASGGVGGSIDIRVLRLNEDFDETTATWNSLTPAGGDTTASELSALTFAPTTKGSELTFGTTPEFQNAVADALANDDVLRLLLFSPDATGPAPLFARFVSDNATATGIRPGLVVFFTLGPPGIPTLPALPATGIAILALLLVAVSWVKIASVLAREGT